MGNLRGGWDGAAPRRRRCERFDWFGPSRVIPDTINEFPSFSFTVGDLHAHVIAVPLTLLALAFVAQVGDGRAAAAAVARAGRGRRSARRWRSAPVRGQLVVVAGDGRPARARGADLGCASPERSRGRRRRALVLGRRA